MDLIKMAQAKVDELEGELQRLKSFIATGRALEATNASAGGEAQSPRRVTASADFSSPVAIVEAAREVIIDLNRPVPRAEMYSELLARGIRIAGEEPKRNLSTILWRADEFENLRGRGYWLAGRELPSA